MTAVPVRTSYRRQPAVSIRDRLFSRLEIHPDGHLLWTGKVNTTGYGRINVQGKIYLVHRLMYQMFVGPIPDGLEIDHLCKIKACAAPAHLEAVTHRTNMLRADCPSAVNAVKRECLRGHPFDLFNTYFTSQGFRQCRTCNQERESRRVR